MFKIEIEHGQWHTLRIEHIPRIIGRAEMKVFFNDQLVDTISVSYPNKVSYHAGAFRKPHEKPRNITSSMIGPPPTPDKLPNSLLNFCGQISYIGLFQVWIWQDTSSGVELTRIRDLWRKKNQAPRVLLLNLQSWTLSNQTENVCGTIILWYDIAVQVSFALIVVLVLFQKSMQWCE